MQLALTRGDTRSRTCAEVGAICRRSASAGGRSTRMRMSIAVQQRAGEPAAVADEVGLRALAAVVAEAARARIRRRDEHEAGREDHHLLTADDRHVAVLERLAQRLQARAGELRQLVEEEHAAVRQGRLARLRRARTAHQARRRDRVVRRAERPRRDQPGGAAQARDRLDAGDLDRLVGARAAAGSTAGAARSSSCRFPAGPAGTGCARPPPRPRGRG